MQLSQRSPVNENQNALTEKNIMDKQLIAFGSSYPNQSTIYQHDVIIKRFSI